MLLIERVNGASPRGSLMPHERTSNGALCFRDASDYTWMSSVEPHSVTCQSVYWVCVARMVVLMILCWSHLQSSLPVTLCGCMCVCVCMCVSTYTLYRQTHTCTATQTDRYTASGIFSMLLMGWSRSSYIGQNNQLYPQLRLSWSPLSIGCSGLTIQLVIKGERGVPYTYVYTAVV